MIIVNQNKVCLHDHNLITNDNYIDIDDSLFNRPEFIRKDPLSISQRQQTIYECRYNLEKIDIEIKFNFNSDYMSNSKRLIIKFADDKDINYACNYGMNVKNISVFLESGQYIKLYTYGDNYADELYADILITRTIIY